MSAIVISDLTKRMGKKKVFQNLDLEVLEGEFFALLGLEGSGKTTIARIIFNYLKPAKGQAMVYDMDCTKDSKYIKESVSYIPEEVVFNENVRASYLFKKTLSAHNLQNTEELDKLLELFNFNQRLRFSEMTESEKKLFAVINSLIIKPRLIVMDEPSKGLSSDQVSILFDHLNYLKESEGLTVFMITDSLMEAQRYCDRAAYLYDGKVRDIEYLKDKISNDKLIRIHTNISDLTPFTEIGAILLKNSPYEKIFYYDKDMNLLSNVINRHMIDDYTIENSSLRDKIAAYYDTENAYEIEVNYHRNLSTKNENIESAIETETEVEVNINVPENRENDVNIVSENINDDTIQIAPKGTILKDGEVIKEPEDVSEEGVQK